MRFIAITTNRRLLGSGDVLFKCETSASEGQGLTGLQSVDLSLQAVSSAVCRTRVSDCGAGVWMRFELEAVAFT